MTAKLANPGAVEDLAIAIFSRSNGAFGSLEAGTSFPGGTGPGERWVNRVYGSRGQILLGHERKVACGAGSGEDRQAVG
jgi:hypothetical protein